MTQAIRATTVFSGGGRFLFGLAVVLALLVAAGICRAQEQPAGDPAVSQEKEPETFKEWMVLAEKGDPRAQCNVGVLYVNGQQVPRDFELGLKWLTRSAEKGFAHAQFVLAGLYSRGVGDQPPDFAKAYFWGLVSAAASDLPAKSLEKAAKVRDSAQERLSAQQAAQVQNMAREWWAKRAAPQ